MPAASVAIDIHAPPGAIFDLVHDYRRRVDWDPFLREAILLNDASAAGLGVLSCCTARRGVGGLAMETVYISFQRPRVAAVKMTRGPCFLQAFAASIRQEQVAIGVTRVTYRYRFTSRPRWLARLLDPIAGWVFQRETTRRLAALKQFCEAGFDLRHEQP